MALLTLAACGGENFESDHGAGGASGTGGTGASGTGGNGAEGGGGGTPADCVPSEASGAVADSCGLFVDASSGSDQNDGKQDSPFKSLSTALAKANGKPIYVCAAADSAIAGISMTASQDVFGGLDCADWIYSGEASAITAAANVVPIRIDGADVTARIEDVAVVAANATEQGADSIALFIAGADVTLSRVSLKAGDGAEGAAGEDGGAQVPVDSAMNGAMGAIAGSAPANATGGTNNCGGALAGGLGGKGGEETGTMNGEAGGAGDTGSGAIGGQGQNFGDGTWNYNQAPAKGGAYLGAPGSNGGPGLGGASLGELTEGGLIGRDGQAGMAATAGKSGGGGGGSAATTIVHGAGGGGGGAGGCAGNAGGGGKAGGSSIALVAVGGTLSLEAVTLTVRKGGVGGKGGAGQFGQSGGSGGGWGADGGPETQESLMRVVAARVVPEAPAATRVAVPAAMRLGSHRPARA